MTSIADVLLVTVNEIETRAVLAAFEEATGKSCKLIPLADRLYQDLGTINGVRVYHALSEMGSIGLGASQQTVEKAIRALRPNAVIAIGVAFGINEKKQAIGDVLISRQVSLYELRRACRHSIVPRGDKPHASPRLLNFFWCAAITSWKGAQVRPGVMLTGEKLIDNVDYRDQLVELEPEAIGGEMEAAERVKRYETTAFRN